MNLYINHCLANTYSLLADEGHQTRSQLEDIAHCNSLMNDWPLFLLSSSNLPTNVVTQKSFSSDEEHKKSDNNFLEASTPASIAFCTQPSCTISGGIVSAPSPCSQYNYGTVDPDYDQRVIRQPHTISTHDFPGHQPQKRRTERRRQQNRASQRRYRANKDAKIKEAEEYNKTIVGQLRQLESRNRQLEHQVTDLQQLLEIHQPYATDRTCRESRESISRYRCSPNISETSGPFMEAA